VDDEVIEVEGCPRQCIQEAYEYMRVYNWAENRRLTFLYAPNAMPAKIGDALDVIESLVDRKQRMALRRTQKKQEADDG